MSEEILEALMQLFALIAKQGGKVKTGEINYIESFLRQQINSESVDRHLDMFRDYAGLNDEAEALQSGKKTSVKDSVKIFSICKKINRTLDQKQKTIVLVRLFELFHISSGNVAERMNIIHTVAEVFAVAHEEFLDIQAFIRGDKKAIQASPRILELKNDLFYPEQENGEKEKILTLLWLESVDQYFFTHRKNTEVFLNGHKTEDEKVHSLVNGSSLRLSTGKPLFYSDIASRFREEKAPTKILFEAEDLFYSFPEGKAGLHNVSFSETHGKLVGIMGASGTGKSTLLNVLCGVEKPESGRVLINGINLHGQEEKLQGSIGFVPQDDLIIEELTVYQNLYYNARLCFGNKSKKELAKMVAGLLADLGLEDKKDLKVGSQEKKIISGGERKRLNIALELIREPSVLFVDEPTSGLSSRDSENVMDLLREQTLKGKLVFTVIHQPSSDLFKLFDKVLLLDEGGVRIYYGNPVESIIHFKKLDDHVDAGIGECVTCGNVNQEIIFNIIEKREIDEYGRYTRKRRVSPDQWEKQFLESESSTTHSKPKNKLPSAISIPGRLKQLGIFWRRDMLSKTANRQYVLLNLLEAPVLGFILSYIIHYIADPESSEYIYRENENIPIYIFMSLIVALFLALTLSAEEIFHDRKILKREKFLNLSRSSYLIAKILTLLIIVAIQSFLFVLVGNSILHIKDMGIYYWFALFSTAGFAVLLGLNISAALNSAVTIYIVIPLLIIPMMILSGAMISFDKLNRSIGNVENVPLIADVMATKWTYEALMVRQFKNNKFEKHFYELEKEESMADFELSQKIPELRKAVSESLVAFYNKELDSNNVAGLRLIYNETGKYRKELPEISFAARSKLEPELFNPNIAFLCNQYFDRLEDHFSKTLSAAINRKDVIINYMLGEDLHLYNELKNGYYNERLADIVKKRFEPNRILIYHDELVQQFHPVYLLPEPSGALNIRTHFFAPEKHLMGKFYDTYWFNMAVVWFMALILYICLHYNLLAAIIKQTEKLKKYY